MHRSFFEPFDKLYDEVTAGIRARIKAFDQATRDWTGRLVWRFLIERVCWNFEPAYEPYLAECARLRPRILKLAACAYLHISYDLPRCIADEWPGQGEWVRKPTVEQAQWAYLDLVPVFPAAFSRVGGRWRVLGGWSIAARFVPSAAYWVAAQWAFHLRTVAWLHARQFADDPGSRSYREQKMLDAMVAALKHVSNFRVWSAAILVPPNVPPPAGVPTPPQPTPVSAVASLPLLGQSFSARLSPVGYFLLGIGAGLAGLWLLVRHRRRREDEIAEFAFELGQRVYEYVTYAVRNPEGLDRYLRRRASNAKPPPERRGRG